MKYHGGVNKSLAYDKILNGIRPIINVIFCSSVILGFLIVSYKLILGEDKEVFQKGYELEENSVVVNTENKETTATEVGIPSIKIDKVKVYITEEDKTVELPLEEYIKGVVSSEMPLNFNKEALKAQAIAARTYTASHMKNNGGGCANSHGADLCDSVHCQVYTSKEKKIEQLGAEAESKWNLVESVVEETKGLVLSYDNELVTGAFYFSTSSGKTENVEDVFSNPLPYLRSVESLGEENAPHYKSNKNIEKNTFIQTVNSNYGDANLRLNELENQVIINGYTDGGCVKDITLGNVTVTGVNFRKMFGLNSANFSLEFLSNEVVINCTGFGHGVGMSQWGANVMASEGKSCEDILKHYYTGVELLKINQ